MGKNRGQPKLPLYANNVDESKSQNTTNTMSLKFDHTNAEHNTQSPKNLVSSCYNHKSSDFLNDHLNRTFYGGIFTVSPMLCVIHTTQKSSIIYGTSKSIFPAIYENLQF